MYFEDFVLGAKTGIAPAVIDKGEVIDFAKKYAILG